MNEPVKAPYGPLVTYQRDGRTEFSDPVAHRQWITQLDEAWEMDETRRLATELWCEGVLAGLIKRSLESLGTQGVDDE